MPSRNCAIPNSFNDYRVRPICLPQDDGNRFVGRRAVSAGWGARLFSLTAENPPSDVLYHIGMVVLDNRQCGTFGTKPPDEICYYAYRQSICIKHCPLNGYPILYTYPRKGIMQSAQSAQS